MKYRRKEKLPKIGETDLGKRFSKYVRDVVGALDPVQNELVLLNKVSNVIEADSYVTDAADVL